MKSESERRAFVEGKRNCLVAKSFVLLGSLFRNWANCAAAIAFFVDLITAVVEPPQFPDTAEDASHCGSGAARHLPEVA